MTSTPKSCEAFLVPASAIFQKSDALLVMKATLIFLADGVEDCCCCWEEVVEDVVPWGLLSQPEVIIKTRTRDITQMRLTNERYIVIPPTKSIFYFK